MFSLGVQNDLHTGIFLWVVMQNASTCLAKKEVFAIKCEAVYSIQVVYIKIYAGVQVRVHPLLETVTVNGDYSSSLSHF